LIVQLKPSLSATEVAKLFASRKASTLHCATMEGMDLRKMAPYGSMVFGNKDAFERV
jgi:hypothetical protein